MDNSGKEKGRAKAKTPEQIREAMAQAVARFVAAASGELSKRETVKAWRKYSALCLVAFRFGRLWRKEAVAEMAQTIILLYQEARLYEEQEGVADGSGDLILQMERGDTNPSLPYLLRMCDALKAPPAEGRMVAGYLTEESQPDPAKAA